MNPRTLLRSALPVVLVATAFLAACGDDDAGSGDSATTAPAATAAATTAAPTTIVEITVPAVPDPLDGTSWTLDSTSLGVEGGDAVVASIDFADGQVSGSSGCNSFSGAYVLIDEVSVSFSPFVSTQIACQDPQAAVETVVLEHLGKVAGFTVTADALTLTDASGATLLTYVPAPTTPLGNWIATGYLKADGSAFVSIILDTEVTASFQADGTVAGSSGCNNYNGPYTVTEADKTIAIGPLAGTKKLCPEPAGVMEQEDGFLVALESAKTFTNDGATLTLFNSAGQRAATFNTFSAG